MFTNLVGVDGLRIDIEVAGDAGAEAGGIKNGTGADNLFGGEAGEFVSIIGQDIHRIGDDEENTIKARSHDLFNHALEDVDVFLE